MGMQLTNDQVRRVVLEFLETLEGIIDGEVHCDSEDDLPLAQAALEFDESRFLLPNGIHFRDVVLGVLARAEETEAMFAEDAPDARQLADDAERVAGLGSPSLAE